MISLTSLQEKIQHHLQDAVRGSNIAFGELTIEIDSAQWLASAFILRDEPELAFEQCVDLCGVDYLTYGLSEWETIQASASGFERGVKRESVEQEKINAWVKPRFAVVYHLLSMKWNQRLAVRVFPTQEALMIDSLLPVWPSVNWYEREAFDLFGIIFRDHPDLRRILTDYGFVGHPFRKDFPLIGNVAVHYDAATERVIYAPVDITPRTLVPRVIRETEELPS